MTEDYRIYELKAKEVARNEFRRASHAFDHVEKIDSSKVEGILGLLGQPFDQKQLTARLVKLQDGKLKEKRIP